MIYSAASGHILASLGTDARFSEAEVRPPWKQAMLFLHLYIFFLFITPSDNRLCFYVYR